MNRMHQPMPAIDTLKVVLIDDNPDDRALVERELKLRIAGVQVRHVSDAAGLDAALDEGWFDVAVTDYELRWTVGTEVLRAIKRRHPQVPVIMFTGSGNEEIAVDAMKEGLDDYITKAPKHYPRVPYAVLGCFERASNRSRLQEAREAGRKQQEELQAILDVLPVGIAISRDPQATHISATPYLAGLLGIEAGADIGQAGTAYADRYRYFRSGAPLASEDWPMRVAARLGQPVRGEELEVRFQDGRTLTLLVNAAPLLDVDGNVRGAVAALVDVSALKEVQRALEEANRQKSEFISVLAHELRNPMAAIGYSVEMLRHVGSPGAINKAREVIARQTGHMGRLLDDLLDLSRITLNRIDLALQPLDIRRVIELAYDSTRPLIESLGHQVRFDLPAAPVVVPGDEVRLTQVVSNLLNNAAKFTPAGGAIAVAAVQQDRQVLVTVSDNGVGIEAAQLERVFEMFSQGQSKVSGGSDGLGIGLALVRRLVELHGGTVQAVSAGAGHGTTLRIALPLADASAEAVEASAQPGGSAPVRLLVADDNVDAADLLAEVLRMEGYAVKVAHDGREAIRCAQDWQPEALILDIGMPHANGLEVARWVRAQAWGKEALLIAVTGWGQQQDRDATAQAGFDVHLVKPVSPHEIMRTIGLRLATYRARH